MTTARIDVEPTAAEYAEADAALSRYCRDADAEARFLVGYLGSALLRLHREGGAVTGHHVAMLRVHDARRYRDCVQLGLTPTKDGWQ